MCSNACGLCRVLDASALAIYLLAILVYIFAQPFIKLTGLVCIGILQLEKGWHRLV